MPALKIAIVGSAPSSTRMAPFMDPAWVIFGCSPGVYPHAHRVNAWIELHRWEPGVIGRPDTQKPWLTPEYVMWMSRLPLVYMRDVVPEIPNSVRLPIEKLTERWGNLWFTSSVAYMLAMSIDDILEMREKRKAENTPLLEGEHDTIGLFGVDMAATEEFHAQRPACQHFIEIALGLGINVQVPPESDLLRPYALYGLLESEPWHIKGLARKRELDARLANATNMHAQITQEIAFIRGALDNHTYHMDTWMESRGFLGMDPKIMAGSEQVRGEVLRLEGPVATPEPDEIPVIFSGAMPSTMVSAPPIDPPPGATAASIEDPASSGYSGVLRKMI